MRRLAALSIAPFLLLTAGADASAQTWGPRVGQPTVDVHRYQLDAHRLEMDRLRLRADQRELEARQSALESRLAVMRVEAARQRDPLPPPMPPRSAASAAERRETVQGGVGQIDAWLDRRAD